MLTHLKAAIEACAADRRPPSQARIGPLVLAMARLQGELGPRAGMPADDVETPAMKRFREAVERAEALAAGRVAAARAVGDRPGPAPPAVEEPRCRPQPS